MNDCSTATTGSRMVLGLDFDDTFTCDRQLWRSFIELAEARGHLVLCVTARADTPENREQVERETGLNRWKCLLTGGAAKRWFAESKGWNVTQWIDDKPEGILNGR